MNSKITIVLVALICLFSFRVDVAAVADSKDTKEELLRKLKHMALDDTFRLEIYNRLARLSEDSRVELFYTNKMMQEAEHLNHSRYKCEAYLSRMILAYNDFNVEEVSRWMRLLEPIARKEKYYDLLFSGQRCVIDMLLVKGEYEREEREAKKMLKSALALDNKKGIILAYQCLANVCGMTYRDMESIEIQKKAYEVAAVYDMDLALEINSSLVRSYQSIKDLKNQLKWMSKMDKDLKNIIRKNPEKESRYNMWFSMNLVALLDYYVSMKDMEKAAVCMKQLDEYPDSGYATQMVELHLARYTYFYEAKMPKEALFEIEQLMRLNRKDVSLRTYVDAVYNKADLLNMMGKEDEAIAMYKRSLWVSDSVNLVLLNRQADQIKADYKTDSLLLAKENIRWNIQYLFLVVVIVIILVLIYFVIQAKRVQKALQKSEQEMREMAEKMEQANDAKEKFLSTISSSINVPLNVVVTESLRLALDEVADKDERSDISQKLNKTSAELMKLINNILNLSKLEAGMMKFKNEDLEFVPFIQSIMAVKKFEGCPVTLNLQEGIEQQLVSVDVERFRDVFNHLLVPSVADVEMVLDVSVDASNTLLQCCVTGTTLAVHLQQQTQEEAIGNEVTRLLIEHFGGSYVIVSTDYPGIIRFTLPLVKVPE